MIKNSERVNLIEFKNCIYVKEILLMYYIFSIFVSRKQCPGSVAGILMVREESPGGIGHSTSESRSYW